MGLLEEKLTKHPFYALAKEVKEKGVYPYFREIEGKQGTEVEMGGHHVLMFGSNAYTGLTGDQRVIDAGCKAMQQYGSGCAGSRFLNGTLDIHVQLEKELAEFVGKDDALVFSTGFTVNSGVIPQLVSKDDYIICDDRDHASIVDGRRLSFATQLHYKHNDIGRPRACAPALRTRQGEAHRGGWCVLYGRRSRQPARDSAPEAQVQCQHHGR